VKKALAGFAIAVVSITGAGVAHAGELTHERMSPAVTHLCEVEANITQAQYNASPKDQKAFLNEVDSGCHYFEIQSNP
jgi:beta-lactamase class A